jgi:hypothetical protein
MSTQSSKWAIKVTKTNAAELEAWRLQQPDVITRSVYDLTNSIKERGTVYLLSDRYDGSYQKWGYPNHHQVITLAQWRKLTTLTKTSETMSKTQTITRKQLATIYDVACSTWQNKIAAIIADKPFEDTFELDNAFVDEMFDASSSSQTKVLKAAGLTETKKAEKPYLHIEKNLSAGSLTTFTIVDKGFMNSTDILIGRGLVSGDYVDACLLASGILEVVPEIQYNVDGRPWVIVFKKK